MIKWYKPSEKMPEVGDEIVIFYRLGSGSTHLMFEVINKWHQLDRDDCHWAYAKEFNFPKEKE